MKIGFISLGCSKNLVDTEMMIGLFKKNSFEIVTNPQDAEIILINTCGFINSAKKEAIDTILEMSEYKKQNCKLLVVTGCMVQRYKEEMKKELPEVDLFVSIDEYGELYEKIDSLLSQHASPTTQHSLSYFDRVITTNGYYAYLKIAEGCSNNCTYCAIPKIRGPYVSRYFDEIV